MLPVARLNDIHIEQVGDDLVLFDQRTDAAHSLNAPAAFVWERCDGAHTCEQIAAEARELGTELSAAAVRQTVNQLGEKLLLEAAAIPRPARGPRLSRRTLAKTAAAVLAPVIVSIASPAQAITLSGPGDGGIIGG